MMSENNFYLCTSTAHFQNLSYDSIFESQIIFISCSIILGDFEEKTKIKFCDNF